MPTTKRNDPCPCGSGKKYKKCCGKSNVVAFPNHIVEDELKIIHQEIVDFAMQHYEEEIEEFIDVSLHTMTDIEDLDSLLTFYSMIWAIFNEPLGMNGQTIFDDYLQRKGSKIKRSKTREIVLQWKKLKPAILRVIEADQNNVELENLVSSEVSSFLFELEEALIADQLIIAFPYKINKQKQDVFIMPFIVPSPLSLDTKEIILENVEETKQDIDETFSLKQYIEEDFTEFLLDTFVYPALEDDPFDLPEVNELDWKDPRHELVANLLTKHMQEEYPNEIIDMALMIWFIYCEKSNPQPKKLGIYAGAMEYFVDDFLSLNGYTQKSMAEKYEVSSSTLATRVRDIRESVSDEISHLQQLMKEETDEHLEVSELKSSKIDLEKKLAQIEHITSEREFESMEELNEFLESPFEIDNESDEQIAQNLVFEAMEATGKKRKKLINDALKIDDNSIDAYVLLGNDSLSVKQALSYYEKALQIGEGKFRDTFEEEKGHFWGIVSTRPFMRAKEAYAIALKSNEMIPDAIRQYEEMLKLNPNDNQGIRFPLCDTYLESNNFKAANKLLEDFVDDEATHFQYNRVIVEYLINGYSKGLEKKISSALEQNRHVSDYLLERKKITDNIPDFFSIGDETEAKIYVLETKHLWKMHKPLLAILREWTN